MLLSPSPHVIMALAFAVAVSHKWNQIEPTSVRFCLLSSIQDPKQVPLAIVQAGDVQSNDQTIEQKLATFFRAALENHGLLIIDSFGHFLFSPIFLSTLLGAYLTLKILVISHQTIRIREEFPFETLPWSLPPNGEITLEAFVQMPSVVLFHRSWSMRLT